MAAIRVVLLEKQLLQFVNHLQKAAEEAAAKLLTYEASESKRRDTVHGLKESSILLNKLVSRVKEIVRDIQQLPEDVLNAAADLINVVCSATDAEIDAEELLAKIEVKLQHFNETDDPSEGTHSLPESVPECEERVISTAATDLDSALAAITIESDGCVQNVSKSSKSPQKLITADEIDSTPSASTKTASLTKTSKRVQTAPLPKTNNLAQKERRFKMQKFCDAPDYEFAQFWKEFHETVDRSSLEVDKKFATLRSLVRGDPYRVFLDLDYRSEEGYREALKRLFDRYANELLKQDMELMSNVETSMNVENTTVRDPDDNAWSDRYFMQKYCGAAPNYQKPKRDLLTRAIHAFLNLYVFGPKKTSNENVEFVWLILLHGVKFDGRYMLDRRRMKIFGGDGGKVSFPKIEKSSQLPLRKYAPCYMKHKESNEAKPKVWEWKYPVVEGGQVQENTITSEKVRKWYLSCWEFVEKCNEDEFQDYVNYFALLSIVLFRVVVKPSAAVEKYVAVMFNKSFRSFCPTPLMPSAVPPHATIYHFLRHTVFKKGGANYKTYLTYLVGSYAFCDGDTKKKIRNYLNAGCMQVLSCVGTGSIYWLRKAAERKNMKTQELLKYFTIDPSMAARVQKLDKFVDTYRTEITWWWARLFEKNALLEISTADCPAFAFACFIVTTNDEKEITKGSEYAQFARFIKKDDLPSVSGKNLGMVVKNAVNEWNMTPLSLLTRGLLKKIELQKCVVGKKEKKVTIGPE